MSSNNEERICRICLVTESEEPDQELIAPCRCKGSCGFVHRHCLATWRHNSEQSLASSLWNITSSLQRLMAYVRGRGIRSSRKADAFFRCEQCGFSYLFRDPQTHQINSLLQDSEYTDDARRRSTRWGLLFAAIVLSVVLFISAVIVLGFVGKFVLWRFNMHTVYSLQNQSPPTSNDVERFLMDASPQELAWPVLDAADDTLLSPRPDTNSVEYVYINPYVDSELSQEDKEGDETRQVFSMALFSPEYSKSTWNNKRWQQYFTQRFFTIDQLHIFTGLIGLQLLEAGLMILLSRFFATLMAFLILNYPEADLLDVMRTMLFGSAPPPGLATAVNRFDIYLGMVFMAVTIYRCFMLCLNIGAFVVMRFVIRDKFRDDMLVDLSKLEAEEDASNMDDSRETAEIAA